MSEPSVHCFKRNVAEWATNPIIQSLTDFQTGWYVNLEMAAFMGKGFIPDDDDLLWRIARARNKGHFVKHKDLVLAEYKPVEVEEDHLMLYFPRMGDSYTQAGLKNPPHLPLLLPVLVFLTRATEKSQSHCHDASSRPRQSQVDLGCRAAALLGDEASCQRRDGPRKAAVIHSNQYMDVCICIFQQLYFNLVPLRVNFNHIRSHVVQLGD